MRFEWKTESVFFENLEKRLNQIQAENGRIFQIIFESAASVLLVYERDKEFEKEGKPVAKIQKRKV